MISVETQNPVFSNARGKSKGQRKERRGRIGEKAKNILGKAKDAGILAGIGNLLTNTGSQNETSQAPIEQPQVEPPKKPMGLGLKIGIGISVLAVVGAIYWFGIRKK